jgi:four helix bundle protein
MIDMSIQSYKDLVVWQKAMDMVENIYTCTKDFPSDEKYGLTSQMRRCAISIPSNIAEGNRRGTRKDYHQFILVAFASGAELETQLLIARRLGYLDDNQAQKMETLLDEIMRMLNALQQRLHSA